MRNMSVEDIFDTPIMKKVEKKNSTKLERKASALSAKSREQLLDLEKEYFACKFIIYLPSTQYLINYGVKSLL